MKIACARRASAPSCTESTAGSANHRTAQDDLNGLYVRRRSISSAAEFSEVKTVRLVSGPSVVALGNMQVPAGCERRL